MRDFSKHVAFVGPDNEDRADYANDAVSTFFQRTRPHDPYPEEIGSLDEDDRDAVAEALMDLLCNLRHWADVTGIDFAEQDEKAVAIYNEEVEEDRDATVRLVAQSRGEE